MAVTQWTGDLRGRSESTVMRWGELTGPVKPNCRTADGYLLITPDLGALHEVGGKMWLGPPKSNAAARRIDLPRFLIELRDEVGSRP